MNRWTLLPSLAFLLLSSSLLIASLTFAGERTLLPALETDSSPYPGDSLDDATVWIHPDNVNQSVILGTVKASNQTPVKPTGILVFDLSGKQLQFLQDGTPNNIDSRGGFPDQTGVQTLIAASHWWSDKIGFYRIDVESRQLQKVTEFQTAVDQLRGLCLGRVDSKFMVVGIGSSGIVEQYQVAKDYKATLIHRWQLASESEGCVIDDETRKLYVTEEGTGIWQFDLETDAQPILLDKVRWFGPLKKGLEGLALLEVNTKKYLVVSLQEKSRFAVYDLATEQHLINFRIDDHGQIDGVSKTDGVHIEATATAIFPRGFMVVHDDENSDQNGSLSTQNFKIVPLESLIELIQKLQRD